MPSYQTHDPPFCTHPLPLTLPLYLFFEQIFSIVEGVTAAMFQGVGMADRILIATMLRDPLLIMLPAHILGTSIGPVYVWGPDLRGIVGSVLLLIWAWITMRAVSMEASVVSPDHQV